MKLGSVTKLDMRNTTKSKKIDDNVMSTNFDAIVLFLIYGQFVDTEKPESGGMVYKTCIFINSNLLSYKNRNYN